MEKVWSTCLSKDFLVFELDICYNLYFVLTSWKILQHIYSTLRNRFPFFTKYNAKKTDWMFDVMKCRILGAHSRRMYISIYFFRLSYLILTQNFSSQALDSLLRIKTGIITQNFSDILSYSWYPRCKNKSFIMYFHSHESRKNDHFFYFKGGLCCRLQRDKNLS